MCSPKRGTQGEHLEQNRGTKKRIALSLPPLRYSVYRLKKELLYFSRYGKLYEQSKKAPQWLEHCRATLGNPRYSLEAPKAFCDHSVNRECQHTFLLTG